jgi:hypothetical protein
MRERIVTAVALALFLTGAASPPWAAAQEKAAPVESTAKENETLLKSADSYKMDFTVNELENGKQINSRSYFMLLRADAIAKSNPMSHLRVGTRVPVATGGGSFQYQDVGMRIDCRLLPMANSKVAVETNWDYSSLAGGPGFNPDPQHPVFRQVINSVEAVVLLNKPTVIAEMDDVASTHRYVFEVKVTKITL